MAEKTPEQVAALDALDQAIRNAWEAFGRSERSPEEAAEDPLGGWERTPPEDRYVSTWMVLLPVTGNDEDQIDFFFPSFPGVPAWQAKGMLIDGLDELRG